MISMCLFYIPYCKHESYQQKTIQIQSEETVLLSDGQSHVPTHVVWRGVN